MESRMKRNLFLVCIFLATPALAGSWITIAPVVLSGSGTATLPVGEKIGAVDKLRLQIEGATVHMDGLALIPAKGDPIFLRHPILLKSGESSGQISIPGPSLTVDKLKLAYRVSAGTQAQITLRVRSDNSTFIEDNKTTTEGNRTATP